MAPYTQEKGLFYSQFPKERKKKSLYSHHPLIVWDELKNSHNQETVFVPKTQTSFDLCDICKWTISKQGWFSTYVGS